MFCTESPGLRLVWRQRDEFSRVPRNNIESSRFPIGLRRFNTVFAGRDEIPPDVARSVHCGAANEDDVRVGSSLYIDAVARFENKEPFRPVPVAGDFDFASEDIERAFLVLGADRQDCSSREPRHRENGFP